MVLNFIAFLGVVFLLGFSILVHEFGHFITAKFFGVPVAKFALGMGPKIWGYKWGETEYVLNWIPFGGFVQMGTGDAETPAEQPGSAAQPAAAPAGGQANLEKTADTKAIKELAGDDPMGDLAALRSQPLYAKVIIFTAGCFMNFVTAIVIMTLLAYFVPLRLIPLPAQFGYIAPESKMYAAGLRENDELRAVNGQRVRNWEEINAQVALAAQDFPDADLELSVVNGAMDTTRTVVLPPNKEWDKDSNDFKYFFPPLEAYVEVMPYSPAYRAGLKSGDRIVSIAGTPVKYYVQLSGLIEPRVDQEIAIAYVRDGKKYTINLKPKLSADTGDDRGVIGVAPFLTPEHFEKVETSLPAAFNDASSDALYFLQIFPREIVKIFAKGPRAIRESLGGVLMIGHVTFEQAKKGARYYFDLFAKINLMLMVMNLLPIPILDGGHIVIAVIESAIRRPIPERVLAPVLTIFFYLLITLAILVTFNDILRIWF